jgi:DNA-binding PadR family transcriptional regulator
VSDSDLSNIAIEILLALSRGPAHGYAIKLDVERRIGDDFILGSGSLYQALQRLERRALISETTDDAPPDNRRGRVYHVTPAGRRALEAEISRMKRVVAQARRLFSHEGGRR